MTLTQIKAMFIPGQKWTVTREGNKPLPVHGNTGISFLGANNGTETRTVKSAKSELVWSRTVGESQVQGRDVYTTWPKAKEVLEARPGYLRFQYDNGTVVTCGLQADNTTTRFEAMLPVGCITNDGKLVTKP